MEPVTGSRIRARRMARGVAQAALAEAAGISASYLNLIEHNHRPIGGALLLRIADALAVEPSHLTDGAGEALNDLRQAGARHPTAETDRIDEFAARFPGWTQAIAAQEGRIKALETQIQALRDRLSHDTALSETMHEVLSSVAAIRSTADILVKDADLNPEWRGRFHRNLHEEAERLADTAASLTAAFELPEARQGDLARNAVDAVEALFDLNDHYFPAIEAEGAAAIGGILDAARGLDSPEARAHARDLLERYAADAAALPLPAFRAAAEAADYEPAALVGAAGGDIALVLRRLASVPVPAGSAPFGLAIADPSGAILYRKRVPGFSIPRHGHANPRWPLFRVAARPGQPEEMLCELPPRRFRAWAVAVPEASLGFSQAPMWESTMLVRAVTDRGDAPAVNVGPE